MSSILKMQGARIFDGMEWHDDAVLVVEARRIVSIVPTNSAGCTGETVDARGHILVPGFIDLQVNGGGGALFNEQPKLEGIREICEAHARFGTTALLPTLITDAREATTAAIKAGIAAKATAIPGLLGLHLEGPHLSVARKGALDPSLIRPMEEPDLDELLAFKRALGCLMVTVAPEYTTIEQVNRLADAGIIVSLGHTDAGFKTACAYAAAGARVVTHLFNAMSGLGHREPGVVGAALATGGLFAGIITDGFHVDPAAMGIAVRSKQGPGQIFLVTDAMSSIGTCLTRIHLNGRGIVREGGRLTLDDCTLAGADIDMLSSVRFVHETLGLPLEEALRMASAYPADAVGIAGQKGRLLPGTDADFIILTPTLALKSSWIGGQKVFETDVHM